MDPNLISKYAQQYQQQMAPYLQQAQDIATQQQTLLGTQRQQQLASLGQQQTQQQQALQQQQDISGSQAVTGFGGKGVYGGTPVQQLSGQISAQSARDLAALAQAYQSSQQGVETGYQQQLANIAAQLANTQLNVGQQAQAYGQQTYQQQVQQEEFNKQMALYQQQIGAGNAAYNTQQAQIQNAKNQFAQQVNKIKNNPAYRGRSSIFRDLAAAAYSAGVPMNDLYSIWANTSGFGPAKESPAEVIAAASGAAQPAGVPGYGGSAPAPAKPTSNFWDWFVRR